MKTQGSERAGMCHSRLFRVGKTFEQQIPSTHSSHRNAQMPVKITIPGTYTDLDALEAFFGKHVGYGKAKVEYVRGSYVCTLPRFLTDEEETALRKTYTHY